MSSAVGTPSAGQWMKVRRVLTAALPLVLSACLEPTPGYQAQDSDATSGTGGTSTADTTGTDDGGSNPTGTSSEPGGGSGDGGTTSAGGTSSAGTQTSGTDGGSSEATNTGSGTGHTGAHLIFVTSATYAADFGELETADDFCQTHADTAGLSGTFVALLSSSTVAARDRVTVDGTIVNMTGQVIAVDHADLWDGTIENAVTYDEYGVDLPGVAWTGTLADGSIGQTCLGWSSIAHADDGSQGNVRNTDSTWVEGPDGCFKLKRFYCISQ